MTCCRCRGAEAADPLGLCQACAVAVRVEIATGLKRFVAYLASWAAFERWLADHGRL